MELAYAMLTGSLSGLLSVLAYSVLWSIVDGVRARTPASSSAHGSVQISEALLHMLAGMGMGLLFWLSWGLAAIVAVPWWIRGLSFGVLCWLALSMPSVIAVALAGGVRIGATAALASRWAATCVIAGLACAWSWENARL